MPANGRSCVTCEWSDKGNTKESSRCCHNVNVVKAMGRKNVNDDTWCSEWKSSEPETCNQCHWFDSESNSLDKCTSHHGMIYGAGTGWSGRNVKESDGACSVFRRKY